MERLVLVHGSVVGARMTWAAQRRSPSGSSSSWSSGRASRRTRRSTRVDFERTPRSWPGCSSRRSPRRTLVRRRHLAARRGARPAAVRSLTGHRASGDAVAAGNPAVDAFAAAERRCTRPGGETIPRPSCGGSSRPSARRSIRPHRSRRSSSRARALQVERGPWEAEIPLDALAAAPFPKLVVSGNHHPAFDAICDVLESELPPSASCSRLRPHGPAPPGLQRPPRRLRRASVRG